MGTSRVLIIDDDPMVLQTMADILELRLDGLAVEVAQSARTSMERIAATDYDTIVSDIKMPDMDGLELLEHIKMMRPNTPTLLITGHEERDLAVRALRGGAYDFIQKPIDWEYFLASLIRAIQMRRLNRLVEEQKQILERHAVDLEQIVQERTRELLDEIIERRRVEGQVRELANELERRVLQRTAQLQEANRALEVQVAERQHAEEALRRAHEELEQRVVERTAELERSHEQMRRLSLHLQSVREEERTQVAREIHDELGQALTVLKIDLSWVRKKLSAEQRPLLEKTRAMLTLLKETMDTVRKIATELRPALLDDLGLISAIAWQTREFQKRTGIRCRLATPPEEITMDKPRATSVFRIFQEALTNIARHAHANRVQIGVKVEEGMLRLKVRDNGRGITAQEIADPRSLGLIGIKERVLPWGGTMQIRGAPGKGTLVRIDIPLEGTKEPGAYPCSTF